MIVEDIHGVVATVIMMMKVALGIAKLRKEERVSSCYNIRRGIVEYQVEEVRGTVQKKR